MVEFLLDTDIAIYTIKHRPAAVRRQFNAHRGRMALAAVSLGELYFGAMRSRQQQRNLEDIEAFAARLHIVDFNEQAAHAFGEVRAELARSGHPIGAYDTMIAAQARACGLTLVTNNVQEYEHVDGLRIVNWTQ